MPPTPETPDAPTCQGRGCADVGAPANGAAPLGSDFARLWLAGSLTGLGSATSTLALPLLVLAVTGSASAAGLFATTTAVAATAARLPAGALADRYDRRRILIISSAAHLVLTAALAVAVATGTATASLVLVLTALTAVLSATALPAEHAAIAQLVPHDQLPRAYARNEARLTVAALAGPPLGGLLYAAARSAPFAAEALTHAVSLLLLRGIRSPVHPRSSRPPARGVTTGLRGDITAGLVHVGRSPFLRAVLLITGPANAALTALTFTTTVALRQAGTSAATIGAASAALGIGALLGALGAPVLMRHLGVRALLVVTTAALLAGAVATSALTGHVLMAAPLALAFVLTPAINTALLARTAATTPHDLLGRVLSVAYLASGGLAALAPAAAGMLTAAYGVTAATGAAAALLVLPLLTAVCSRAVRTQTPVVAALG